MSDEKLPVEVWILLAIVLAPFAGLLTVIFFLWMFEFPLLSGIVGTAISSALIFLVVRYVNRRDDPRFAKRPPDAF